MKATNQEKKEVIYRSIGFYDNTRNNSIGANQKTRTHHIKSSDDTLTAFRI